MSTVASPWRESLAPFARPVVARSIAALCLWIGWDRYLLVQVPTVMLAGAAGIRLFYAQHQFEDTYWHSSDEWSYAEAALRGSPT